MESTPETMAGNPADSAKYVVLAVGLSLPAVIYWLQIAIQDWIRTSIDSPLFPILKFVFGLAASATLFSPLLAIGAGWALSRAWAQLAPPSRLSLTILITASLLWPLHLILQLIGLSNIGSY